MRAYLVTAILGLVFLTGCLPDFVSVSDDGTIALTLTEDGEFKALGSKDPHIYLTNANADFLIKVEGLEGCGFPQISPSSRSIVTLADDGLALYDRESKKARVIYPLVEGEDDWSPFFPIWSPDESKVAFFVGEFEDDPPKCRLYVYDVNRRERTVLARRACPRAAWWPDSKHLLYISVPPGVSKEGGEPPFGDLKLIDVRTAEERTLVRRRFFSYSRVAVFPGGNAILYPCLLWDKVQITRQGVAFPLVLKKEIIPGSREEEKPTQPEEAEAKPGAEEPKPAAGGEKPEEKGFILKEGQPFHPSICEVSPDGKKIAYARKVWEAAGSDKGDVQPEKQRPAEEQSENARGAEGENTESEGWEVCVANSDGTGSVAVARTGDDEFLQVLWVSNSRLIYVGEEGILAVDADGKNKLNLTEAIVTKFADQFKKGEEKKDEEQDREPEGPPAGSPSE